MFCYQCEQTAGGEGCKRVGVCGKDDETATLQDCLIDGLKHLSKALRPLYESGKRNTDAEDILMEALFATLTNTNFDPSRIERYIREVEELTAKVSDGGIKWSPGTNREELLKRGKEASIERRMERLGVDVVGLQETVVYGLKGVAAYVYHARKLGKDDADIYRFTVRALARLADEPTDIEELYNLAMDCGRANLGAMRILDAGNTERFGDPTPTQVDVGGKAGKALLVSGHDLADLELILKQAAAHKINVYTHGEMLPAHGYPKLREHKNLVGHWGTAWHNQRREFEAFKGAIVLTTNCLVPPKESYKGRVFTCGAVGYRGVAHIEGEDFGAAVKVALDAEGFAEDAVQRKLTVGFGRKTLIDALPRVLDAVKSGKIRRIYLVGGCDGAKSTRSYYTEFVEALPPDTLILTLGCGKYRINHLDLGEVAGFPRLLDAGQCNDAYAAIILADTAAKTLSVSVNDLPLSIVLSWFEQKAVAILLSLFALGVRNIRLGPSFPAFLTPTLISVLAERHNIKPIGKVEEDIAATLEGR